MIGLAAAVAAWLRLNSAAMKRGEVVEAAALINQAAPAVLYVSVW